MEGKNTFIAYLDWKEIFDKLPDDVAGKLIKHVFSYVSDEDPDAGDILIDIAFTSIKQDLKRDLKKYTSYIEKQRVNGKSGGRPQKPTETQKTQAFFKKPKKADNDNDNVYDNDIIILTNNNNLVDVEKNDFSTLSPEENIFIKPPAEKRKKVAQKKEKLTGLYQIMTDRFFAFYKQQTDVDYKMTATDGHALKNIINYLEKISNNKHPAHTWDYILSHYDAWGKFYQEQIKITQIDSNLPNIILNIKSSSSSARHKENDKVKLTKESYG